MGGHLCRYGGRGVWRLMANGCITSAEIFFFQDVVWCGSCGWHESFFNTFSMSDHTLITGELVFNDTLDWKVNLEQKTREVADIRMYDISRIFFKLRRDMICL